MDSTSPTPASPSDDHVYDHVYDNDSCHDDHDHDDNNDDHNHDRPPNLDFLNDDIYDDNVAAFFDNYRARHNNVVTCENGISYTIDGACQACGRYHVHIHDARTSAGL